MRMCVYDGVVMMYLCLVVWSGLSVSPWPLYSGSNNSSNSSNWLVDDDNDGDDDKYKEKAVSYISYVHMYSITFKYIIEC